MTRYAHLDSPVGALLAVDHGDGLAGLYYDGHRRGPDIGGTWHEDRSVFGDLVEQLGDYFAGNRRTFDLEIAPVGSQFQREVWDALSRVPFGATCTYGELAGQIGRPSAARAVGVAVGRNPVSIIVPCHRVIGAGGGITGYAGGLDRKRTLLALEGVRVRG